VAGGGAVGGWEVMGGGGAWWVWILGSDLEEKMEKKGGEVYSRYREMRGMGKIDLKIGPGMAQLECVRTSISAFDRTRAKCRWCQRAQRSNLQGKFDPKRA
jgi:hypothetical protein